MLHPLLLGLLIGLAATCLLEIWRWFGLRAAKKYTDTQVDRAVKIWGTRQLRLMQLIKHLFGTQSECPVRCKSCVLQDGDGETCGTILWYWMENGKVPDPEQLRIFNNLKAVKGAGLVSLKEFGNSLKIPQNNIKQGTELLPLVTISHSVKEFGNACTLGAIPPAKGFPFSVEEAREIFKTHLEFDPEFTDCEYRGYTYTKEELVKAASKCPKPKE